MTKLTQGYNYSKPPVCQQILTFYNERNLTLTRTSGKTMKTLGKMAGNLTAFLVIICCFCQPISAKPTTEALQYSQYGSGEDPDAVLPPTTFDIHNSPPDSLLEDILSSPGDIKILISKQGNNYNQKALHQWKQIDKTKRSFDFGTGRGDTGNLAAKHRMGMFAAQYMGKRKRSGLPIYYVEETL